MAAALTLDNKLDRLLSVFHGALSAFAALPAEDDLAQRATRIVTELFPAGVGAVTSMTHADEIVAVDRLVKKLGSEHAKDVAALNLTRFVEQLAATGKEFRAAVARERPAGVSYDQVRAAQAEGQELLLRTVVMILGRFPGSSEPELQNRAALLGPILQQNESIAAYRRSRRPVRDVDPKTGEETQVPAPEIVAPQGVN